MKQTSLHRINHTKINSKLIQENQLKSLRSDTIKLLDTNIWKTMEDLGVAKTCAERPTGKGYRSLKI